jgi:hypothetical protein
MPDPGYRRFAGRVLVVLLPALLMLLPSWWALYTAGEFTDCRRMAERQGSGDQMSLFGPAYTNPDAYYKLYSTQLRKPGILALGSSRVMQFRSFFFNDPDQFYNAGGGVATVWQFRMFLDHLPSCPHVLILGLDQDFFNPHWAGYADRTSPAVLPEAAFKTAVSSWRDVYHDALARKFTWRSLTKTKSGAVRTVGMNATVNHDGFRNDGSYCYGKRMLQPEAFLDYQFRDTLDRIARGNERFEYAQNVGVDALRELDDLLAWCQERRVHVVGFLPPFAHAIYQRMRSMPDGQYDYLFKLPVALKPIFTSHGYPLFDFSDLASCGASDDEAIDGSHASEKAYARLLAAMAAGDPTLSSCCDRGRLIEMVNAAVTPLRILNEPKGAEWYDTPDPGGVR